MKITLFLLALIHFSNVAKTQSLYQTVIGSGGSDNSQLSWTIGEPVASTISDGNVTLTQGFQQPTFVITNVSTVPVYGVEVSLYPNPATNYVVIKSNIKNYSYKLINEIGEIIQEGESSMSELTIDLSRCQSNKYFVKIVSEDETFFKSYKLVKYNN